MIRREELIKIGRFNKPHGVRGELSFTFTDDIFDRCDCPYLICEVEGIFVPFFVEEYRFRSDTSVLMKLEDVDTEEEARQFILTDVYFPKSYMNDAAGFEAPGDYFIGYRVVDREAGELGLVTGVDDTTENVLFVVEQEGRELLIPVTDDFILSVDEKNRTISMALPDGLLQLN